MLEKAHHNKFTLNKEKKTLLMIIPNHPWFFDTKRENENTFSEIKERKRKSREQMREKENKRKRKIKQGKKSYSSNKLL